MRAASGNTTVPMSRPSITPPPRDVAHARWRSRRSARTAGLAATTDTARVTSGPRISMVASIPSTVVTPLGRRRCRASGPARPPGRRRPGRRRPGARRRRPTGTWRRCRGTPGRGARRRPGRRWTCPTRPGPSMAMTRSDIGRGTYRSGRRLPEPIEHVEEPGERLGHAAGVGDDGARRAEPEDRRSSSPCGGRRRSRRGPASATPAGRTTKPSVSSSASTPQRRSSVTMAAMRSVSLRRMNPIPVTRVGRVGEGGHDGERRGGVGQIGQVDLDAPEPSRRAHLGAAVVDGDVAAHAEDLDEPRSPCRLLGRALDPHPPAEHGSGGERSTRRPRRRARRRSRWPGSRWRPRRSRRRRRRARPEPRRPPSPPPSCRRRAATRARWSAPPRGPGPWPGRPEQPRKELARHVARKGHPAARRAAR